jgi:hypothetical protein
MPPSESPGRTPGLHNFMPCVTMVSSPAKAGDPVIRVGADRPLSIAGA